MAFYQFGAVAIVAGDLQYTLFNIEEGPAVFLMGYNTVGDGSGGFFKWKKYEFSTPPAPDTSVAYPLGYNIIAGNPVFPNCRFERIINYDIPDTPIAITQSVATRLLNGSYVISTIKNCFATYSFSVASLLSAGTVFFEISPDNSTWQTVSQFGVGAGLTLTTMGCIHGFVPKSYYTRLRTTGTATIIILNQQEVLI